MGQSIAQNCTRDDDASRHHRRQLAKQVVYQFHQLTADCSQLSTDITATGQKRTAGAVVGLALTQLVVRSTKDGKFYKTPTGGNNQAVMLLQAHGVIMESTNITTR